MTRANDHSERQLPAEAAAGETAVPTVRLKMRLALTQFDVPPHWPFRLIEAGDTQALAQLMYDAYHGTGAGPCLQAGGENPVSQSGRRTHLPLDCHAPY